jgi:hypothetical protein
MLPELPQLVIALFIGAIAVTGYEMRLALRPPACAECPHCRAARGVEVRQQQVSLTYDDWYEQRYRNRGRDDEPRP